MRTRVLAAAAELGYEQNLLAQGLRSGASMAIGFVVRDISNPMMAEIVLGAERTLRASGYSLLLTNSEGKAHLDAEYVRYFRQRAVDGLLVSLSDETNDAALRELKALSVPFVAVDRELPEGIGGAAVLSDHRHGIEVAVRYLIGLGHRRFGLISGPASLRPGREAAAALTALCSDNDALSCAIESGDFTREFGELAMTRLLTSPEPPTAVIASGYLSLLGALAAIRAFEKSVPRDISIVTFDDPDALSFFEPPITALSREPLELGQRAARLLLDALAGNPPGVAIVEPVFRPRLSCGPPT